MPDTKKIGGARPGAGRPAELQDRTRVSFYIEADVKERLTHTATLLNGLIEGENENLPEEDQDHVTSASELARFALREELAMLAKMSNEEAAKRFRPNLGQPRLAPDQGTGGQIFVDRDRMVTYVEGFEKDDLEMHANRINVAIERANQRIQNKSERTPTLAWSEIARYAVDWMLEQYGRRAYILAGALRPYLGQRKP